MRLACAAAERFPLQDARFDAIRHAATHCTTDPAGDAICIPLSGRTADSGSVRALALTPGTKPHGLRRPGDPAPASPPVVT